MSTQARSAGACDFFFLLGFHLLTSGYKFTVPQLRRAPGNTEQVDLQGPAAHEAIRTSPIIESIKSKKPGARPKWKGHFSRQV